LIATIALVFGMTGAAFAAHDIQTQDIAKRAVTGSKLARDAVKGGKILDGKVKAKDLAPGVIPQIPAMAYGRINKNGATVAPASGAVGISGVTDGGPGVICYDLATVPASGSATVANGTGAAGSTVVLRLGPGGGCPAPYNDAQTTTTSAPSLSNTSPYQEGSSADRDVYVQFIGG
jgi:hypothetical protein